MQSVHEMLRALKSQRRQLAATMGDHPISVAAGDVLEWLIRRAQMVADRKSDDSELTLRHVRSEVTDDIALLELIATTFRQVADLIGEGVNTLDMRRAPLLKLVQRIEADGYWAGLEPYASVIDGREFPELDEPGDPTVQVQLAAEKIARAEQASVYQQRLERMAAGITRAEDDYAQRIRGLIGQDG